MPRRFDPTERTGVNVVEGIVTKDFKWIWREQHVADFGIDGQIEVVDEGGSPTGKLFAVQVKAGPSYFRGSGESVPFYVDEEHMKYWNQHILPVILILHNIEDGQTLWQWADLKTARATTAGWCIDVPRTKIFDATSRTELQDQVWTDDSVSLRRRFALDRQFMSEFQDRAAFLTIEKWVNKSLQYRGLEVRFDDPHKSEYDYEIPIMATWHYEISDLMRHFLPWLEYDYAEEPDDGCAEVEGHILEVWLSKSAKAFLELEAYFENPPQERNPEDGEPDVFDEDWYDAHSMGEP